MKTELSSFSIPARRSPSVLVKVRRFLRAMIATRAERLALRELEPRLYKDVGLTDDKVRAEVERPVWDIPDWWR